MNVHSLHIAYCECVVFVRLWTLEIHLHETYHSVMDICMYECVAQGLGLCVSQQTEMDPGESWSSQEI